MDYRRQNHAVYYTRYHLIFTTKFRRKLLKGGMGAYLTYLIRGVQRHCPEIQIIDINTDQDHVHILLSIAPKLAIADAVRSIKANTARQMKRKFPFLEQGYFDNRSIWSIGYFVSTVGINESVIRKYIELQGREDSGQAVLVLKDATGVSP
ncbi:MAG TPA: IS200/IS605 family transposase [Candidatus Andersenbacteria bacterium]|nr:IS200/IS605 family transposase [Candidatus Andersenbacteria bacterium]